MKICIDSIFTENKIPISPPKKVPIKPIIKSYRQKNFN